MIMNSLDNQVKLSIKGDLNISRIPLLEIATIFQEFHYVVDKSYMSLHGIQKMTQQHRDNYNIVATKFESGSFITTLDFMVGATAIVLPGMPTLSPNDIWNLTKLSYDYLKQIFIMKNDGLEPNIILESSPNSPIFIGHNNKIHVDNRVFIAADKSEPHFKKIASTIKHGKVEEITALDIDNKGFILTEYEKKLFNPEKVYDEAIFNIKANIYRYDKESNVGRLKTYGNDFLPGGDYKFKPIGGDGSMSFIIGMSKDEINIRVMKEMEKHVSGATRISQLLIVSIDGMESLF